MSPASHWASIVRHSGSAKRSRMTSVVSSSEIVPSKSTKTRTPGRMESCAPLYMRLMQFFMRTDAQHWPPESTVPANPRDSSKNDAKPHALTVVGPARTSEIRAWLLLDAASLGGLILKAKDQRRHGIPVMFRPAESSAWAGRPKRPECCPPSRDNRLHRLARSRNRGAG